MDVHEYIWETSVLQREYKLQVFTSRNGIDVLLAGLNGWHVEHLRFEDRGDAFTMEYKIPADRMHVLGLVIGKNYEKFLSLEHMERFRRPLEQFAYGNMN